MGYGRAIFCATARLLKDAVAQKNARPHVCHRPYLMTHMRSRKKLRDHISEQARGRAISARPHLGANTYDPGILGL